MASVLFVIIGPSDLEPSELKMGGTGRTNQAIIIHTKFQVS
jgi:hypothetical protein